MPLFSPNTFTLELSDGTLKRVPPLSMMDRLEFAQISGEMMEYLADLSDAVKAQTFQEVLYSDETLQKYINLMLGMVGLEIKTLSPDMVLALLFPYVDEEDVEHTRGLLFERNFADAPETGATMTEAEIQDQFYQRLADLSMHFDGLTEVLNLAREIPAQMLDEIAAKRSVLMRDAGKTDKEKHVEEGKKKAKENLKALMAGNDPFAKP